MDNMNHKNKFIARDFSRTEHDDFVLNVEDQLCDNKEAVPVYDPEDTIGMMCLGWKIQYKYE